MDYDIFDEAIRLTIMSLEPLPENTEVREGSAEWSYMLSAAETYLREKFPYPTAIELFLQTQYIGSSTKPGYHCFMITDFSDEVETFYFNIPCSWAVNPPF